MRSRQISKRSRAWSLGVACIAALGCAPRAPRQAVATEASPTPSATVADTSCLVAFDSLRAIIRRDYAGYRDKSRGHERALAALADSVRDDIRSATPGGCIPAFWRWTGFFKDPHMMVWQSAPPAAATAPAAEAGRPGAAVPDPDTPTLRFLDDSTAVVRLPSLDPEYEPTLDSLVVASRPRLLSTATLVVDLRGNGGGCTCTYDALLPLVYGGPYREAGQDILASPANVAFVRSWLSDESMPAGIKAMVRSALPRMESAPNQFVPFPADTVIRLDTIYPMPRSVALLVDEKCASSCEDFLLMARQSPKVTIVGTGRTAGVHDYGNVRSLWLPGWRRMRIPTSRSRRLPAGAIDNVGLVPDVLIPTGERDTLRFVTRVSAPRPGR